MMPCYGVDSVVENSPVSSRFRDKQGSQNFLESTIKFITKVNLSHKGGQSRE